MFLLDFKCSVQKRVNREKKNKRIGSPRIRVETVPKMGLLIINPVEIKAGKKP